MYDALLGGSHNFEIDRAAAARATAAVPDLPLVAQANRTFLRRAMQYLVRAGIRQFLDIGAGIPTVGSSHEIARQLESECTVAYVDLDPVAVAHAEAILIGDSRAVAVRADLREPAALLADESLRSVINLDRPVGVLLVAVGHLLTDDDDPWAAVAALRDAVVPGSYLALSHLSSAVRPQDAATLAELSKSRTGVTITFRPRAAIEAFFAGWELVEPGVVELPHWRPDPDDEVAPGTARSLGLAGVARRA
jgi:hypothetical protein